MTYPTSPPIGTEPRPWAFPDTLTHTMDSGLTIRAVRMPALPMVHVRWSFRAGRTHEDPARIGVAKLLAAVARHGTEGYDSRGLAEALDFLGARMHTAVAPDNTVFSAASLSEHLDRILDLADEVALRPTFPEADLERERNKAIEIHRHERSQPEQLAGAFLSWALYGDHPYGRPTTTAKGLAEATREDLVTLHRRLTNPAQGLLLVVGDIDPEDIIDNLSQRTAHLEARPLAEPPPHVRDKPNARKIIIDRPGSEQSAIILGQLLFERSHPDYLPLRVVNQILGAGASSRLFLELRERQSLTYSPYSAIDAGVLGGDLAASLSCAPDKTATALKSLRAEVARIASEPIPEQDIEEARRYIIGSFPQKASGVAGVAALVNTAWLHGLDVDTWSTYQRRVREVSTKVASRAASDWIDVDEAVTVLVGPREQCLEAAGDDAEVYALGELPFEPDAPSAPAE